MLEPNTILQQRYRVVRSLGRGGMGAVYEATDERFGNRVALKQALVSDERLGRAFEREARLLRSLRHRALPGVIDYFHEGTSWFLVMDYVPGEDLGALAERSGAAFPISDVLAWGDQLLDVLEFLHGHEPPIVHRDVKPQNLKLTPDGRIVLLDFGLSKGSVSGAATASGLHSVYGYTPHFAPLEQIRGSGTDPRSDLYATAATLWSLATGLVPPDALQRAAARVGGEPDPLRPAHEVSRQVPEALSRVLHLALEQSPERRPQSAAAFRRMLADARATAVGGYATLPEPALTEAVTVAEPVATAPFIPASPTLPASGSPRPPVPVTTPPTARSGRGLAIAAVVAVLLAAGIAVPFMIGVVMSSGSQEQEQKRPQNANTKQPTDNSNSSGRVVPKEPMTIDLVSIADGGSATRPFGDTGVRVGSGTIRVEQTLQNMVMPAGASRLLFFFGPGFSGPYGYHVAEVTLDGQATSVTVTRPGVTNNASTPAWQIEALDGNGQRVGSLVGEGDISRGNYLFPSVPQDFTIMGSGIKRLRISSNNNQSTFAAVPFTRVSVTMQP